MPKDDQKKEAQALYMSGVSVEVLDAIERKGAEASPRIRRNDLILHLLTEFAEGRISLPLLRKEAA